MDSIYFHYNGKHSEDIGVYLVNLDSGLKTTRFLAERTIISEQIPDNPIPYVYGVQDSPLNFTLTLSCLDNKWTFEKRREVARWLDTKQFEEFYSEDNPSKRYYFMYEGGIDLTYGGELTGYIQVQMRNISPYTYSPVYTKIIDCSLQDITEFTFTNDGDDLLYPELEIYKVGAGDLSIINFTNGGKEFKFTGLADKETVYVDNLNHHIESDLGNILRYDNFNHNYLELPTGVNTLKVIGKCRVKIKYQLILKG